MKHKFKKAKLILPLTFMGLMGVACVGASTINNVVETKAYQNYMYGESMIGLSTYLGEIYEEMGAQAFTQLHTEITYNNGQRVNTYIINYSEYEENATIGYENNNLSEIFYVDKNEGYCWLNTYNNETYPYGNIEITQVKVYENGTNQTLYGLLNHNVADLTAVTPPTSGTVGQDIVETIGSGLGLISDLASEFLLGFTALFWNTTNSTLTTFGIFALVMLGVAVSFAVIKLVLNILRSNTGA